jgi:hypothetical protein
MNNGIEASREIPRFTCPEIFLNEFYAPMCRKVVDSATAKIIHDNDLATEADHQIDKMGSYEAGATGNQKPHF